MTAKTTATRAEAIAAAVARYAGDDFLIHWDQSEYMHGVCQALADTFGVSDPENARSEIWDELNAAFEADKRRAEAEQIAADQHAELVAWMEQAGVEITTDLDSITRAALTAAVLAGMEAAS